MERENFNKQPASTWVFETDQKDIDSLKVYLERIGKFPVLAPQQEPILFKSYKKEKEAEKNATDKLMAKLDPQQQTFIERFLKRTVEGKPKYDPERILQKIDPHKDLSTMQEEIVSLLGERDAKGNPGLSPLERIFYAAKKDAREELWKTEKASLQDKDSEFSAHITTDKQKEQFQAAFLESNSVSEMIINCNLKLVASLAAKQKSVKLSIDDRIQAGYSGLSRAIEGFEPEKGNKFSTYASNWIKQTIQREVSYAGRNIKYPQELEVAITKAWKELGKLIGDNQKPTIEEITEKTMSNNITKNDAREAARLVLSGSNALSFNEQAYSDKEDITLGDIVAHPKMDTEEEALLPLVSHEIVNALDRLNPRERVVFDLLLDGNSHTEIGRKLNIRRKEVTQIEEAGRKQLQKELSELWEAMSS